MKKSAFTLIEILVVLAVIGLLALVMVPAVTGGLAKARRSQCLGNLKNIGSAFSGYAAEHRGRMPSVGGDGDFGSMSDVVKELFEDGFLESLETWVCPTDANRKACKGADVDSFNSAENCSYAYFEGYRLLKVDSGLSTLPLACDKARGGGKAALTDFDNHGEKIRNVVYLDGSARSLKTAEDANGVVNTALPDGVSLVE